MQYISSSIGLYPFLDRSNCSLCLSIALGISGIAGGIIIIWVKSYYVFVNLVNSQEGNCSPLSKMTSRGIPWPAKMNLTLVDDFCSVCKCRKYGYGYSTMVMVTVCLYHHRYCCLGEPPLRSLYHLISTCSLSMLSLCHVLQL